MDRTPDWRSAQAPSSPLRMLAVQKPVDLSVVVMDRDGANRQVIEPRPGTCRCVRQEPSVTWTAPQLGIGIPNGPDQGHRPLEIP
jgi:hypothetical protein